MRSAMLRQTISEMKPSGISDARQDLYRPRVALNDRQVYLRSDCISRAAVDNCSIETRVFLRINLEFVNQKNKH